MFHHITKHRGIFYFDSRQDAIQYAIGYGPMSAGWKIREYVKGHAIQLHDSGPYLGPKLNTPEQITTHCCAWCKAQ